MVKDVLCGFLKIGLKFVDDIVGKLKFVILVNLSMEGLYLMFYWNSSSFLKLLVLIFI